jgi:hypothetical protein
MQPLQGAVVMLVLLALALAPWLVARALRWDRAQQVLPEVMTGPQAAARHLYGEEAQWDELYMQEYDQNASVRAPWEQLAAKRLAGK